jgi:cell division septal protein FtsQ
MKNFTKILSALFFLITIGVLSYLSVSLNTHTDYKINLISLEGNTHISQEQYLQYANIADKSNYDKLTVQIIKDRFERHPYIKQADVRYDGNGKVSVKITEKTFESLLIDSTGQYILTEHLQLLPVLPQTKKIDYPVISNPILVNSIKVLSSYKKNIDILTATKIISSVKLINPELYDNLSSIDLQNGGDVILSFSNFDYPVIVGRNNEIKKLIYFTSFWNHLKGKEINKYMEYVDLRFSGHVYFGLIDSTNGLVKNIDQGPNKI